MTQTDKAEAFQLLHRQGCFIIPNAWDAGSARILASLGFPALATTSAGLAFMLGRPDGQAAVSRAEALANAADIVGVVALPVSADLEDGYGPAPKDCVETVRRVGRPDIGRHRSIGGGAEAGLPSPTREQRS